MNKSDRNQLAVIYTIIKNGRVAGDWERVDSGLAKLRRLLGVDE